MERGQSNGRDGLDSTPSHPPRGLQGRAGRCPLGRTARERRNGGKLFLPHGKSCRGERLSYRREGADEQRHRPLSVHREIGRAHVSTPVTNAHLVCRLLLEKKQQHMQKVQLRSKTTHT